jgi:TetR/AcrR family transcriptional regulator, transcriptional repressor for nem operon
MTDSKSAAPAAVARRPGKPERLVAAAMELVHQQGIERTTVAEVAKAADVPAGNVYYYVKTNDDVIAAVVEVRAQQVRTDLAAIGARQQSPKERLKSLVCKFAARSELTARYGCPLGSLRPELGKRAERPSLADAELMLALAGWAEEQFRALGRSGSRDLAFDLMAGYQGCALPASTMRDPGLLDSAACRLNERIDSL